MFWQWQDLYYLVKLPKVWHPEGWLLEDRLPEDHNKDFYLSLLTSSDAQDQKPVPVAFPTAPQNRSELAAVVSFRDDGRNRGRIEVSWYEPWAG